MHYYHQSVVPVKAAQLKEAYIMNVAIRETPILNKRFSTIIFLALLKVANNKSLLRKLLVRFTQITQPDFD
jgi:hypothetical protein